MKPLGSPFCSSAAHLLLKGTDIQLIQVLLGHGCLKTNQIYTHLSKKSLANIKSPLDFIIESQDTVNHNIKRNGNL